ncbi:hypothetical protein Droror1_Dr00024572 [Drosera rotundifolia]
MDAFFINSSSLMLCFKLWFPKFVGATLLLESIICSNPFRDGCDEGEISVGGGVDNVEESKKGERMVLREEALRSLKPSVRPSDKPKVKKMKLKKRLMFMSLEISKRHGSEACPMELLGSSTLKVFDIYMVEDVIREKCPSLVYLTLRYLL